MPSADRQAPPVRVADWRGEKQLVVTSDVGPGVLLLAEYPIAFVEVRAGEDDTAPWLLLESLLASHDTFGRVSAADLKMTKWPLGPADEARLEQLARKYKRNAKRLAQLYHRVAANNVRYTQDDLTGYGIWPVLSRCNHSCDPNARVCGAKDHPLAELLLSTRALSAGAAIGWNYFSDASFLELDWSARNARLYRDFRFLCQCVRCESERPAHLSGLSKAEVATFLQGVR